MEDPEPHSRKWYTLQAGKRGGNFQYRQRVLDGPEPETPLPRLLESLLIPEVRVLEAGCGHGPDAV